MTEVMDPPRISSLAAALDRLTAAQDEVAAMVDVDHGQLWTLGSVELIEATVAVHRAGCRSEAVLHALVREVDARGAGVALGAPHTAGWLKSRLRLHPGHAKRLVATARGLYDTAAGPLVAGVGPGTGAGAGADEDVDAEVEPPTGQQLLRQSFAEGEISGEHASLVTRTLSDLPPVDAETYEAASQFLAEQAPLRDPAQLARLGRRLRHVLDPDAGEKLAKEESRATLTRSLEIRVGNDGTSTIKGRFDAELTAMLLAQLEPLSAPRPATDGTPDARPVAHRRADAVQDLLRLAASAEGRPTRHGTRPTVTVTIGLEDLRTQLAAAATSVGWPSAGGLLDWSGPISAEAARRLACDAKIVPVILGANGEPLDVGRASYSVTTAIWRALVARDRGCSFAGCDRPPEWTEAHHNDTHWVDGGATSVANMCLLCDHHHRAVHHHGWRMTQIDGQMWTIPPPWIDPTQAPRRNTGRHLLDDIDEFRQRLRPEPPTE